MILAFIIGWALLIYGACQFNVAFDGESAREIGESLTKALAGVAGGVVVLSQLVAYAGKQT